MIEWDAGLAIRPKGSYCVICSVLGTREDAEAVVHACSQVDLAWVWFSYAVESIEDGKITIRETVGEDAVEALKAVDPPLRPLDDEGARHFVEMALYRDPLDKLGRDVTLVGLDPRASRPSTEGDLDDDVIAFAQGRPSRVQVIVRQIGDEPGDFIDLPQRPSLHTALWLAHLGLTVCSIVQVEGYHPGSLYSLEEWWLQTRRSEIEKVRLFGKRRRERLLDPALRFPGSFYEGKKR